MAVTKSPVAAALIRRSMTSQGVIRSESEMMQVSCPIGAPSSEAAFWKAEMPGRVSMVMSAPLALAIS